METLPQKKIIFAPVFAAVLLFGLNSVFLRLGFYHLFSWLDVLMHFLGGIIAAAFFAIFFQEDIIRLRPQTAIIFIAGVAVMVGIFWEFFEWGMDRWFVANFMGDLDDTLSDLLMDFLGGLSVGIVWLKNRGSKGPL